MIMFVPSATPVATSSPIPTDQGIYQASIDAALKSIEFANTILAALLFVLVLWLLVSIFRGIFRNG